MNYVDFIAGNKEYKLRLSTRNVVALEKGLECNPLMIFGAGDRIPTITNMVQILHASLQQYHHKITLDDAFDIFELTRKVFSREQPKEDGNDTILLGVPTPLYGRLELDTEPSGASVYAADECIGKTPFAKNHLIGEYEFVPALLDGEY